MNSVARLRIKEIAESKKINRSQLQIKSGVTLPLLNRYWHNATKGVKLDALERIAKALGVKTSDLIIDDDEAEQKD